MSSSVEYTSLFSLPVATLQYRDITGRLVDDTGSFDSDRQEPEKTRAEVEMTQAEFGARLRQERAEGAKEAEQKLRLDYEQKLAAAREQIAGTIRTFTEARDSYFARAEAEIVQLSLAIASRILHRQAQVEPMLVATLVKIAVEKMREESSVTIRVGAGRGGAWKQYCGSVASLVRLQIVEDPQLTQQDCILETELGSANFGLDAQLKEVEQGFFDLLALRPTAK